MIPTNTPSLTSSSSSTTNITIRRHESVPDEFLCPISLELMRDPVTLSTGITYDRTSILKWLESGHRTCPVSGRDLPPQMIMIPNLTLRRLIRTHVMVGACTQGSCSSSANKVGIRSEQQEKLITRILGDMACNFMLPDRLKHLHSIAREESIKGNKQKLSCFDPAGRAADVLVASLLPYYGPAAQDGDAEAVEICKEALGLLRFLEINHQDQLASNALYDPCTIDLLAFFICQGKAADRARLYAVKALEHLLKTAHTHDHCKSLIDRFHSDSNVIEGLLQTANIHGVKRASIHILLLIIMSQPYTRQRLIVLKCIDAQAVPVLIELLAEADTRACEKASALLNFLLCYPEGCAAAANHALAVPVIVKKMFSVSPATIGASIDSMLRLTRANVPRMVSSRLLQEAVEAGAIHKSLALLQTSLLHPSTREKTKALLRLLQKSHTSSKATLQHFRPIIAMI